MSGLGRKEWSPGDTLTAADVNGYLMDQSVMVFAGTAERGSAIPTPSAGMVSYSTATGLEVYNGSSFTPVTKILQVASVTKTDTFTTGSATYTDLTGLTLTITPSSTTSKILVTYSVQASGQTGTNMGGIQILRGATAIGNADAASNRSVANTVIPELGAAVFGQVTNTFLDSPATTSATTYKLQIRTFGAGGTSIFVNRTATDTDLAAFGRGTSTLTVMEISA
jgi:hypothetical protein